MAKSKRHIIQLISTVIQNGYFAGFLKANIYRGPLKNICTPGFNCYSCPAALGACPIGSLQSLAAGLKFQFSFYVAGFLMLIGTLTGRLVCGFVCPFGFLQDLLYKIRSPKIRLPRFIGYFKYVFLIVFVLLLPALLTNKYGFGEQFFCKYVCPAGTLEAGIPLALMITPIRESLSWLFGWKLLILAAFILLAILSKRPFCRGMCPLGAIYSLFNPISLYKLHVDTPRCIKCNKCQKHCPVDIKIYEKPNSLECIRCGECKRSCPVNVVGRNKK